MILVWNQNRFEARFENFADEQPRLKEVGFKTDGPPAWVWYSLTASPLAKLRENKPAVLNITPEAREKFQTMYADEARNEELKKAAKKAQQELKKKLKVDQQDKLKPNEYMDPAGFVCLVVPPKERPPAVTSLAPKRHHETAPCFICGLPVYSYEYGEGRKPACLWCQKIVLDNASDVC